MSSVEVFLSGFDGVVILCAALHTSVRVLSGRRFPSKLLQKMEERKEREEGEENIL